MASGWYDFGKHGDEAPVGIAGQPEVGLAVPGQLTRKRDRYLKQSAAKLLDEGYRRLFKESVNLKESRKGVTAYREGFEKLGPNLKAAYRAYFAWYQDLLDVPNGAVGEGWGKQLAEYTTDYAKLRVEVDAVLMATKGTHTKARESDHLYQPPDPDESWASWMKKFPTGAGIGVGLVVAIVAGVWLANKYGGDKK